METRILIHAVKGEPDRLPEDVVFRPTTQENSQALRSQIVISNVGRVVVGATCGERPSDIPPHQVDSPLNSTACKTSVLARSIDCSRNCSCRTSRIGRLHCNPTCHPPMAVSILHASAIWPISCITMAAMNDARERDEESLIRTSIDYLIKWLSLRRQLRFVDDKPDEN